MRRKVKNKGGYEDPNKALRGLIRRQHFESGGTVDAWRGTKRIETDRRKQNDRDSCRNFKRAWKEYL